MKDEEFLENYTLYNLEKCELSQELLKEENHSASQFARSTDDGFCQRSSFQRFESSLLL